MARIRMLSVGSRGDLQPYLAILLELQRRGHQVSLIGSVNFQAVAEAHGLPFVSLPGDFTSLLRSEAGLALMQGKPVRLIGDALLAELLNTAHAAMEGTDLLLVSPLCLWGYCQPTSKTEPEATRKLSHLEAEDGRAATASQGLLVLAETAASTRSTAGVGFGMAPTRPPHAPRGLTALEGAMQTPEEVLVMRQLLERGWSRRRIAAELGISRNTLDRYLRLGEWQPYSTANRPGQLDGHREWLQQQFEQHHGNAEVVRQELLKQKGIEVSLRTVERAVQTWREALRQSRQATVRYETPPGKQLQADFGELWLPMVAPLRVV
jgi:transposase